MPINPTVTRNEDGSWAFAWAAGTTPYSIWLDGELLASGLATEAYEISSPLYEDTPPPIEVLNDGDTSQNEAYPPRILLQWRGIQAAGDYVVQRYNGSAWVRVATLTENGSGTYQWASEPLADVTSHQHRVIAYSEVGASGTPIAFTAFLVRNPAPPSVSLSIDGSGDVEVSSG